MYIGNRLLTTVDTDNRARYLTFDEHETKGTRAAAGATAAVAATTA